MATHPDSQLTTDPQEHALLTVELELMRNPSIARLNGGRRRTLARNVLRALDEQGLLATPEREEETPLRLAA